MSLAASASLDSRGTSSEEPLSQLGYLACPEEIWQEMMAREDSKAPPSSLKL